MIAIQRAGLGGSEENRPDELTGLWNDLDNLRRALRQSFSGPEYIGTLTCCRQCSEEAFSKTYL